MMSPMNVSLTPQMEKYIARRVKQGVYQTSSEVVRAAIRLLQHAEEGRQQQLEELRREIQLGLDDAAAGRVKALDGEKIKAEGRKRLAARKLKNAS
jgi:antitoxin ParD1/3/4